MHSKIVACTYAYSAFLFGGNASNKISPKMSIYSTLITTYGLKKNEYSSAFIKTITFEDLFA